jgi:hypothetical protein
MVCRRRSRPRYGLARLHSARPVLLVEALQTGLHDIDQPIKQLLLPFGRHPGEIVFEHALELAHHRFGALGFRCGGLNLLVAHQVGGERHGVHLVGMG